MNRDFKKEVYKKKKQQSKNKFKESFLCSNGTVKPKYRYGVWDKEEDCIDYQYIKNKDYFISLFKSGDVAYEENSIENYYMDLCFITLKYCNNRKCRLSVLKSEVLKFSFIPDEEKLLLECGGYQNNHNTHTMWWT